MPRGGKRVGAGRKSSWPSGCGRADTKLIRVPIKLADELLEIARKLDAGESLESVTQTKGVDSVRASLECPGQLPMTLEGDHEPIDELAAASDIPEYADGKCWLTLAQAYERASERGCSRTFNAFRSWVQRSPLLCERDYRLRRLPSSTTRNTAPGFEDLDFKS